jgi:MFS family permease
VGQIAAVAIGNALQFYDFLIYSFFAIQIGHTFFPSRDAATSLLASLATFGVGYLARPIGAVAIGILGDRAGRKPAMILSFALMGVGVIGLCCTPSYASIGVAAPIAAIVFRLVQGFAIGGEVGPSTALLVEAAPPGRRGFYVSLQYATQDLAVLIAGLVGLGLASVLDSSQLVRWGWRIAFLIGATVIPFGLIVRRGLPETLEKQGEVLEKQGETPERPRETPEKCDGIVEWAQPTESRSVRRAALCLIMLCASTVCFVVLNYMTTYAAHSLHLPTNVAFSATVTVGLCGLGFDLLGGWLADRYGRKWVMIAPWTFLLAAVIPAYWVMIKIPTLATVLGATALLAIPVATATTSVLVTVAESMPSRFRSGAIGTLYAISATVFGGTTQFVVTWLIEATGSPLAPAWYMTIAIALGLTAMLLIPETAPGH